MGYAPWDPRNTKKVSSLNFLCTSRIADLELRSQSFRIADTYRHKKPQQKSTLSAQGPGKGQLGKKEHYEKELHFEGVSDTHYSKSELEQLFGTCVNPAEQLK